MFAFHNSATMSYIFVFAVRTALAVLAFAHTVVSQLYVAPIQAIGDTVAVSVADHARARDVVSHQSHCVLHLARRALCHHSVVAG